MTKTEAIRVATEILALPKEALVSAYAIDPIDPDECDPWSAVHELAKGGESIGFLLDVLGGVRVTASGGREWRFPSKLRAEVVS